MKRILTMLLALAMVFTLFACSKTPANDKAETTAATKVPATEMTKAPTVAPTEPPADAKTLISQGKYEEAYAILYAQKSDPEAAEMLKDFVWVYEEFEKVYSSDYGKRENYKCTYDADGKLVKQVETITTKQIAEGGVLAEYTHENTYEYTYDSKGNLIKEIDYDDGVEGDVEYIYNSDGKLIKKEEQGRKTEEYTYDSAENLVKKTIQYARGGIETYEYTYDAKGNVTKQRWNDIWFAGGSVRNETYEYTYDSNERLIKKVETFFDSPVAEPGMGAVTTYEYTYDTNGNLIKEYVTSLWYAGPRTTEYTYDSNGNLTKKIILMEDTSREEVDIETYEYTYDSNGNLLKESATTTDSTEGFLYTVEYSGYKLFYKPQNSKTESAS